MENSHGFKIKNVAMHEKACAEPTTTCADVKNIVKNQWGGSGVEILDVKCMFKTIFK